MPIRNIQNGYSGFAIALHMGKRYVQTHQNILTTTQYLRRPQRMQISVKEPPRTLPQGDRFSQAHPMCRKDALQVLAAGVQLLQARLKLLVLALQTVELGPQGEMITVVTTKTTIITKAPGVKASSSQE